TNTYNYYDIAVARLNADGSLDNSFNGTGKRLIDLSAFTGNNNYATSSNDFATAVAIKPSGKIDIAGYTLVDDGINQPHYAGVAIQVNGHGNFDNTFDTDGIAIFDNPGNDQVLYNMALQQDGKILYAGVIVSFSAYYNNMLAIRLTGNG